MKFDLTILERFRFYKGFFNPDGNAMYNMVATGIKNNKALTPRVMSELIQITKEYKGKNAQWYDKDLMDIVRKIEKQIKATNPLSKDDEIKNLLMDMLNNTYGSNKKNIKKEYHNITFKDVESYIKNL